MRVVVAGASGVLGSRLVPQLIEAGHEVIGTHNSPASAQLLEVLGAPNRSDSTCSTRVPCARPCSTASRTRSCIRQRRWRTSSSAGAWTRPSPPPTACAPRERTRCWPPPERRACAGSWRRASHPTYTGGRADRPRRRPILSMRLRRRTPARPTPAPHRTGGPQSVSSRTRRLSSLPPGLRGSGSERTTTYSGSLKSAIRVAR